MQLLLHISDNSCTALLILAASLLHISVRGEVAVSLAVPELRDSGHWDVSLLQRAPESRHQTISPVDSHHTSHVYMCGWADTVLARYCHRDTQFFKPEL